MHKLGHNIAIVHMRREKDRWKSSLVKQLIRRLQDLIVELMRRFATYGMKQTCGIRVSQPTAQLLHKFWLSEPIQQVYHERYNFELLDSAS